MHSYVKIPLALLFQAIYVLECIDIYNYDPSIQIDYEKVLSALNQKRDSLELRASYANIINAKDDDSRLSARIRYLQHKRDIREAYL